MKTYWNNGANDTVHGASEAHWLRLQKVQKGLTYPDSLSVYVGS